MPFFRLILRSHRRLGERPFIVHHDVLEDTPELSPKSSIIWHRVTRRIFRNDSRPKYPGGLCAPYRVGTRDVYRKGKKSSRVLLYRGVVVVIRETPTVRPFDRPASRMCCRDNFETSQDGGTTSSLLLRDVSSNPRLRSRIYLSFTLSVLRRGGATLRPRETCVPLGRIDRQRQPHICPFFSAFSLFFSSLYSLLFLLFFSPFRVTCSVRRSRKCQR